MATLTGSTIASTYPLLLKIDSGGVDGTLRKVEDGDATDSSLSISTTAIAIDATDKLYLDAGDNTYIHESSADVLKVVVGGVAFLDMTEGTNAIVINEGSTDMDFRVESNGNANMLFVDGGNDRVAVGTNTPTERLHVADGNVLVESTTTTDNTPTISIKQLSTTSSHVGGNLTFGRGDPDANLGDDINLGDITWYGQDNSDDAWIDAAYIRVLTNGTPDTNQMPAEMQFWTNGGADNATQRMCIMADGKVGFRTDAPSSDVELESINGSHVGLSLYCTNSAAGDPYIRFGGANDTGASATGDFDYGIGLDRSADEFVVCYASGGINTASSGIISKWQTDGDFYTNDGTVHSLSDSRIKTDIKDLADGLSILNQLKPRTFKYNNKTNFHRDSSKTQYGFIADEVLSVASQYVKVESGIIESITKYIDGEPVVEETKVDDMKSLSMTKMIPMIIKSIQELSAKVTALESK